jgi:ABC-2 type transport system permease protein
VLAFIKRDFSASRSYRTSFLFDLIFGFAELLLFFFISRTFGHADVSGLHGAPTYFAFAAVGIAVTIVLQTTTTALAHSVRQEQLTGTLEALVVQPINAAELSLGLAGYAFASAFLRAAFYIVGPAALLGLSLRDASWSGFVIVLLAATTALVGIGVVVGAVALVLKGTHTLAGIVTLGMGLLSGAFFPISVLPDWIEPIGKVLPTRFAFDGLRNALFRGGGWGIDAVVLLAFALCSFPIAVWAFARAIELSRRVGSLGQY